MNDWDNLDNTPEDDDFDWLNDDDGDDDLGWLGDESSADDVANDLPDWMADMPIPEASDDDIDLAKSTIDDSDDGWGVSDDDLGDWGSASASSASDSSDDWGLSDDSDDDSWLSSGNDDIASDDDDSWLTSVGSDDDDDDDSWMISGSDDDGDDTDLDSFINTFDEEDTLDFDNFMSDDDDGDVDFAALVSSDDDDVDFDSLVSGSSEETSTSQQDDNGGWGVFTTDDDDWGDETPSTDDAPAEDLGVPDWLADMPVPGEDEDTSTSDSVSDGGSAFGDFGMDDLEEDDLDFMSELDTDDTSDELDFFDEMMAEENDNDPELDFMSELDADDTSDDLDFFDEMIAEESDDDPELDFMSELDADDTSDDLDFIADLETDDTDDDLADLLAGLSDDDDDIDDLLSSLDDGDDVDLDDLLASVDEGDEDDDDLAALLGDLDIVGEDEGVEAIIGEEPTQQEVSSGLDFFDMDVDEETVQIPDSGLDFLYESVEEEEVVQASADDDLAFLDDENLLEELDADAETDLDFFNELEDDIDNSQEAIADSDDLAFLDDDESIDDFFQEDAEADLDFFDELEDGVEDSEDWFEDDDSAGTDNLSFLDDVPEGEGIPDTGDLDWLDDIENAEANAQQAQEPERVDIDALIDSFDLDNDQTNTLAELDEDDFFDDEDDLDSYFSDLDSQQDADLPDGIDEEAIPDWLRSAAREDASDSAAALIRQREDRSLDELDDRLLDLRERGLELTSETDETPEEHDRLSKIVPNLDEALIPARITPSDTAVIASGDINMTALQQERAQLLSGLVGTSLGAAVLSSMQDDEAETTSESTSSRSATDVLKSFISQADRFIIVLLLIAMVVLPFSYSDFSNIGLQPPASFAEDSPEFGAFTLIDSFSAGDYVLIATEYGATGARELDTATQAYLEHMLTNGVTPVIVSSDAVGLLRAENIVVNLLGEDARNQSFVVAGFLPGSNIGLRDFAGNIRATLNTDNRGNVTNLPINSLDDFGAIILISESGETVRNWMEQVAPNTDSPIIVTTGQAARPLAVPYVSATDNAIALLVGYEDAFTYQQMALARYNPLALVTEVVETVNEDVADETNESEDVEAVVDDSETDESTEDNATDDSEVEVEPTEVEEDTDETVEADEAEETTEEIATVEPTVTPEPTAIPTNTPEPTATPDVLVEVGTIVAEGTSNVRAGAGSGFEVVNTVEPNDTVLVLDRDETGDWLNIQLVDGSTGWIADFLVDVEEIPSSELDFELAPQEERVEIGTVIADAVVNVRAGAGSDFGVVGTLAPADQVRVIGISADGEWYQIVLPDGQEGWIAGFLLDIESLPSDEWDGASDKDAPVHYRRGVTQVEQDDNDTVVIGTNVAGINAPIYNDEERSEEIASLENGGQVVVLEEGDPLSLILLEDGRQGYIETRLIRIEALPRADVEFLPTSTPTPTLTPTLTPTITPTSLDTATPFVQLITPAPFDSPDERASSQALGLITAFAIIGLGNIFWILRWLGKREQ